MEANIIAIINQKGGVGKSTTTVNLGAELVRHGRRVLLVDADPQGNLSQMLGWHDPDNLSDSLGSLMKKVVEDEKIAPGEGILHHAEGMDLLAGGDDLTGLEVDLINTISRETVMRTVLNDIKQDYDTILIDCPPSLGLLTINALAAAHTVIVTVQAHFLPVKGMQRLMRTVHNVRRRINPQLSIAGILITLVERRTNFSKEIGELIRKNYGQHVTVYETEIPRSVKAAEMSAAGKSIFAFDPKGKIAKAYADFTKEVLAHEKQC